MLNQQEENTSLIGLFFSIKVDRNELKCHYIISLHFFLLLNATLLSAMYNYSRITNPF